MTDVNIPLFVITTVSNTLTSRLIFPPMVQQPLLGQGLIIIEASPSRAVRHTTLGRTPLDEDEGFEPEIPTSERRQTHALDRADTGTDNFTSYAERC
jgi:hypothetical protein